MFEYFKIFLHIHEQQDAVCRFFLKNKNFALIILHENVQFSHQNPHFVH